MTVCIKKCVNLTARHNLIKCGSTSSLSSNPEPTPTGSTKTRRSSCDTPDQHQQQQQLSTTSGTDQATVTSSISTTTEGEDDFESPSKIKYKLIAGGGNFPRATCTTAAAGGKSQVNIITNPLVRQYPFETNYKTKKMFANETIVTHQPGGNLKTISYGGGTGSAAAQIDMKKSPLVNRRRSSSVTLPQPPMPVERYLAGRENINPAGATMFDGGTAADGRNSR